VWLLEGGCALWVAWSSMGVAAEPSVVVTLDHGGFNTPCSRRVTMASRAPPWPVRWLRVLLASAGSTRKSGRTCLRGGCQVALATHTPCLPTEATA
jgi:hypothetical protein